MLNAELQHYEDPTLWTVERYLKSDADRRRFSACLQMIPDSVTSILDVGCGNGIFLAMLEKQNHKRKLIGIERSSAARKMSVCDSPVLDGTIEAISHKDRSFDLVAALEVIEHLPFQVYENALREVQRVAKHFILLSVPYKEKRRRSTCPYCGCTFNSDYHMRTFDNYKLETLFDTFRLARVTDITVQDYLLGKYIRQLRQHLGNNFQGHYICPQCGFNKRHEVTPTGDVPSSPIRPTYVSLLKKAIPQIQRVRWRVALYERFE